MEIFNDSRDTDNPKDYLRNFTGNTVPCFFLLPTDQVYDNMTLHLLLSGVELPLTLVALIAVLLMVESDKSMSYYVINLLLSDLCQLCIKFAFMLDAAFFEARINWILLRSSYIFGLMVSVGFMLCIAIERYLAIAKPLWFRSRKIIKTSLILSVIVWILPLPFILLLFVVDLRIVFVICGVFFLLPLPLFVFFLVRSIQALSACRSVPVIEKQRIVVILVVVLLIYTLLFLPYAISLLLIYPYDSYMFNFVAYIWVSLNPLADSVFYVLLRKDLDKCLPSLCCFKASKSTNTDVKLC